jgi:hypothetical protein
MRTQDYFTKCAEAAREVTGGSPFDKNRLRHTVTARHLVIWAMLATRRVNADGNSITLRELGQWLGGFNHATIIHAGNSMRCLIEVDRNTRIVIREFERALSRMGVNTEDMRIAANKLSSIMFPDTPAPALPIDRLKFNLIPEA